MSLISSLKFRLIFGFTICAILVIAVVIAGVFSLNEIKRNFSETADSVLSTFDEQSSFAREVQTIRSSLESLREASKIEVLNEVLAQAKKKREITRSAKSEQLWEQITEQLLPLKRDLIIALDEQERALLESKKSCI